MKNENQPTYNPHWNTMQSKPQLELKLFTSNYINHTPEISTSTSLSLPPKPLSYIPYFFENSTKTNNTSDYYWLHPKNSTAILSDDYKYPLLNDKEGFLDHLSIKQFSLCAVRTSGQQVALVLAHYFQDLMKYKMEIDTLVWDDKLTEEEGEDKVTKWEEKEWTERIKSIPSKIYHSFLKIQSVTLCMRCYEYALNQYYNTSIELMDIFTKDSLHYSRRQAASTIITRYTTDYFDKLFFVCLWSNCIRYLSDYSVTQLYLLCKFWYKCYFRKKGDDDDDDDEKSKVIVAHEKRQLFKDSCNVIMVRFLGWVFSSATAAVGGIVYPKFGTLLGGNLGDSLISSLAD